MSFRILILFKRPICGFCELLKASQLFTVVHEDSAAFAGRLKYRKRCFFSCSGSHFEMCDAVIRVLTHVAECLYLILCFQIGFNRVNTGLVGDSLMGPSL